MIELQQAGQFRCDSCGLRDNLIYVRATDPKQQHHHGMELCPPCLAKLRDKLTDYLEKSK